MNTDTQAAIPTIHPVAKWNGNCLSTIDDDLLCLCSCGLLYPAREVDAHGWTSCPCGRLGQRFDGTTIDEFRMWKGEYGTTSLESQTHEHAMTPDTQAAAERLLDGRLRLEDFQGPTGDDADMLAALIVARDMQVTKHELREILALLDNQRMLTFEIHAEVKARLQKLVGDDTEGR